MFSRESSNEHQTTQTYIKSSFLRAKRCATERIRSKDHGDLDPFIEAISNSSPVFVLGVEILTFVVRHHFYLLDPKSKLKAVFLNLDLTQINPDLIMTGSHAIKESFS